MKATLLVVGFLIIISICVISGCVSDSQRTRIYQEVSTGVAKEIGDRIDSLVQLPFNILDEEDMNVISQAMGNYNGDQGKPVCILSDGTMITVDLSDVSKVKYYASLNGEKKEAYSIMPVPLVMNFTIGKSTIDCFKSGRCRPPSVSLPAGTKLCTYRGNPELYIKCRQGCNCPPNPHDPLYTLCKIRCDQKCNGTKVEETCWMVSGE